MAICLKKFLNMNALILFDNYKILFNNYRNIKCFGHFSAKKLPFYGFFQEHSTIFNIFLEASVRVI